MAAYRDIIPPREVDQWFRWTRAVAGAYAKGSNDMRQELQGAALLALVQLWPKLPASPEMHGFLIRQRLVGAMLDQLRRLTPGSSARRSAKRRAQYHGVPFVDDAFHYPRMCDIDAPGIADQLPSPYPMQDEQLEQAETRALVEQAAARLHPRTQHLIHLLLNEPECRTKEIGKRYRVSESRASQIRKQAIEQIQAQLQARPRLEARASETPWVPDPPRAAPRPGRRHLPRPLSAAGRGCSDPR